MISLACIYTHNVCSQCSHKRRRHKVKISYCFISLQQPPEEEHKTKFTAPKIISPRFRRLPLQSVNKSETEGLCDSPTGNFRPFHTPAKESCSQVKTGDLTRRDGTQVSSSEIFEDLFIISILYERGYAPKRLVKRQAEFKCLSCKDVYVEFYTAPKNKSSASQNAYVKLRTRGHPEQAGLLN